MKATAKEQIRALALSLESVSEVDHWGRPAFRTKKRIFAVIRPDGLWLYLPEERKEFLFEADPQAFVKYMWGKHPELLYAAREYSEEGTRGASARSVRSGTPAEEGESP